MRRCRNDVDAGFRMRAAVVPNRIMILDEGQSTAPSAKLHTDPLPFFDRKILWSNAGVLKCFARGSQGQRNRARDVFAILRTEFSFPIEALYLGSNLNRQFGESCRLGVSKDSIGRLTMARSVLVRLVSPKKAGR